MDEALLRELFATPPPEFVAARNAAAKVLRAEKRRDEATAVAALRRPGWDDWALNVVAAEHAGTVGAFADAAEAVRDAQAAAIEGRDGPDIRTSLRQLRDASAELIGRAGDVLGRVGRQPGSGEINSRLSEIATSGTAVETLRAGVLGSGGDPADELFAGLQPGPRAPRPASTVRRTSKERPSTPEPRDTADDRAERKRRREALAAATREQRAAAKVLARADAAVEAATEAAARAERALAAAQRRPRRRRRGTRPGRRRPRAGHRRCRDLTDPTAGRDGSRRANVAASCAPLRSSRRSSRWWGSWPPAATTTPTPMQPRDEPVLEVQTNTAEPVCMLVDEDFPPEVEQLPIIGCDVPHTHEIYATPRATRKATSSPASRS